jgi:glycosyltransferase involved in cell wall biosynthesis
MAAKLNVMLLQTRYIESISYLSEEIAKAFPADRYDVSMVYLEKGDVAPENIFCKQIFLGLHKTDYKGLRLKAIKKLGVFLQENHFDVIIANMYKPINLLMQLRHRITASLCVGIIHAFGEFDRLGRRLVMRWMIDNRWRIVAVSQPLRDYLLNARCGLNASNTLVINNAIDVKKVIATAFEKLTARKMLHLPEQGMLVGTLGRSVKGKRQLELVKAFHQFVGERQDVYLVIIGDGELHNELKSYVALHGLHNKVFLPGYVPSAVNYLRALDIFVFPSEHEGFGMALLEAMALSLPTLVNQVEPLMSIQSDDDFVVDTSDVNLLAAKLEACLTIAPEVLKQKGLENYQRASNHYDISVYRRAYLGLIESHFFQK